MGEDDDTELKQRINLLLWEILPDKTTLKEADELAIKWWLEVRSLKEKHK